MRAYELATSAVAQNQFFKIQNISNLGGVTNAQFATDEDVATAAATVELSNSARFRNEVSQVTEQLAAATDNVSRTQVADNALTKADELLDQIKQLAEQASEQGTSTETRAELQTQADELMEEYTATFQNAEYGSQNVFGIAATADEGVTTEYTANAPVDVRGINLEPQENPETFLQNINNALDQVEQASTLVQERLAAADQSAPFTLDNYASLALGNVRESLLQIQDLAQQAATPNLPYTERSNLESQIASLVEDVGSVLENTTFDGQNVFTTDANADVLQDFSLALPTIDLTTEESAQLSLGGIEQAIEQVGIKQDQVQQLLNEQTNQLTVAHQNYLSLQEEMNSVQEATQAAQLVSFTQDQILFQSDTASLAQATIGPQVILQLLDV